MERSGGQSKLWFLLHLCRSKGTTGLGARLSIDGRLVLRVVGERGDPLNVLRLWPGSNLGQLVATLPAGE